MMQSNGLIYTTEFYIKRFYVSNPKCPLLLSFALKSESSLKGEKSSIIPGSEWKVPQVLCKPLAGRCSLSHQEEFWLVANPFFVRKLTKSV